MRAKNKVKRGVVFLTVLFVLSLSGMAAYSASDEDDVLLVDINSGVEIGSISMTEDMLLIEVSENDGGVSYTAGVAIEEQLKANPKHITVQLVDPEGNHSDPVKVQNPFYVEPDAPDAPTPTAPKTDAPYVEPPAREDNAPPAPVEDAEDADGEGDIEWDDDRPIFSNPFTPAGTGEVLDNTTSTEGEKEFFTITTKAGNIFYLIIDRQRETENVYFLNAVTEADLMALAEEGDGSPATPKPTPEETPAPTATPTPEETEPAQPEAKKSGGSILLYIIGGAALLGVGYYVKIYKPKHQPSAGDEDDMDYDLPPQLEVNEDAEELEDMEDNG
jgi:hypothetical protein